MNRTMDALTAAQHKAAEALYRQQQQQGGPTPGGGPETDRAGQGAEGQSQGSSGDVIDAEVVDEEKK
jgi:hypothetical protein